jgi:DHA1 family bicyclomycin/chloramphenicol resistance-like MFS transporter
MVSILSNNTALPMTGVMACCAIASFSILMIGRRIIYYTASVKGKESAEIINTL